MRSYVVIGLLFGLLGCAPATPAPDDAPELDGFAAADSAPDSTADTRAEGPEDAPGLRDVTSLPEDVAFTDVPQLDAFSLDAFALDAMPDETVFTTVGPCGVLDSELTDDAPHWVQHVQTFATGWSRAEAGLLTSGAQTILAEGTAGGSSGYSEAFAFETLARCEGARLLASETMIRYSVPSPGSITDILVELDGLRVGVSVTRAVTVTGACRRSDTYSMAAATELLMRKLAGINESSTLVVPEQAWVKQILFVYADTTSHAEVLMSAWSAIDASLRADTVLYVSVSEADDGFLYFEDRCM